jgi:hypothetical protein
VEEVIKLFSGAFEQTCGLKVIDGFEKSLVIFENRKDFYVRRFRIIYR